MIRAWLRIALDVAARLLVGVVRATDGWIVPLVLVASGVGRRLGVVVSTGQHGLRFTLGRVGRVLGPGFHPLVPGLQTARVLRTRARTLDVEDQRVTTRDGLVVGVDASVTFRVVDVVAALTQVANLDAALLDALAVSIHDVLARADRDAVLRPGALDRALHEALAARVAVWGVAIESAGFASLAPAGDTVRLTQLRATVETRRRAHAALVAVGLSSRRALTVLGAQARFVPRGRGALRADERVLRSRVARAGDEVRVEEDELAAQLRAYGFSEQRIEEVRAAAASAEQRAG